jgi:hypothetical protein
LTKKQPGKTLADLRAVHDKNVVVPTRIKNALAKMIELGTEWEYEGDFVKMTGLSVTDFSRFRDQFTDFWAELPSTNGKSSARRAWFATKKLADAWKEI